MLARGTTSTAGLSSGEEIFAPERAKRDADSAAYVAILCAEPGRGDAEETVYCSCGDGKQVRLVHFQSSDD